MPSVWACCHVLGLTPPCSLADVRTAFRRQALAVHPDKGGSSAAFHRVMAAYETLATQGEDAISQALPPKDGLPVRKRPRDADDAKPDPRGSKLRKPPCGNEKPQNHAASAEARGPAKCSPRAQAPGGGVRASRPQQPCQAPPARAGGFVDPVPQAQRAASPGSTPPPTSTAAAGTDVAREEATRENPSRDGVKCSARGAGPKLQPSSGPTAEDDEEFAMLFRGQPLLGVLSKCLKALPPAKRRQVVTCGLVQQLRLALERWMVQQRGSEAGSGEQAVAHTFRCDASSDSSATDASDDGLLGVPCELEDGSVSDADASGGAGDLSDAISSSATERSVSADRGVRSGGSESDGEGELDGLEGAGDDEDADGDLGEFVAEFEGLENDCQFRITGIQTRSKNQYRAVVNFHSIRIYSHYFPDLESAVDVHITLSECKRRTIVEGFDETGHCFDGRPVEEVFAKSLEEGLRENGLSAVDFRGMIEVPARYWINRKIIFPSMSLTETMQVWREVKTVRPVVVIGGPAALLNRQSPGELLQCWIRLRRLYLEKLRQSARWTQLRDDDVDSRYAQQEATRERYLQEWNRCRMQEAERRQQQIRRNMARDIRQSRQVDREWRKLQAHEHRRMGREDRCAQQARRMALHKLRGASRAVLARERSAMRREDKCARTARLSDCVCSRIERRIVAVVRAWARFDSRRTRLRKVAARREQRAARQEAKLSAARARQVTRAERAAGRNAFRSKLAPGCPFRHMTMDEIMRPRAE